MMMLCPASFCEKILTSMYIFKASPLRCLVFQFPWVRGLSQTAPWKWRNCSLEVEFFVSKIDHVALPSMVSQHLMLTTRSPAKWTDVHWKGTIWKIWFIFQKAIFWGYVSFQGGHHFREISSLGKNTTWQATNQRPSPSLAAVRKGDAHEKAEGMSAALSGSTAVLVPLALTSSIIMTMGSPDPPCRKASRKEMSFTTMHFQVLYSISFRGSKLSKVIYSL